MTSGIGVAISTTGDPHRMPLLQVCVQAWWAALSNLGLPTVVYVTVDGDEEAVARVHENTAGFAIVARVGQPLWSVGGYDGRLGVAANKNTGIELLMSHCGNGKYPTVTNLFLSDDDTWPFGVAALTEHMALDEPHSMVCWGGHRMRKIHRGSAWTWPRGSVLFARREVLVSVGGMREEFGPGGHEHVEWSRRIHQKGLTRTLYPAPDKYFHEAGMGAKQFWYAEDMVRPGETMRENLDRRARLTSVRRPEGYQEKIDQIMARTDGDTSFVPFRAQANGRASATLYHN